MEHKIKSIMLIVALIAIIATVGILISNENGITGGSVAKTYSCYQDSDCDDRIPETKDICKNQGTEYSLCVNRPIE